VQRALAAEAADIGSYVLHLPDGELVVDERVLELSGLDRTSFTGRAQDVYARMHPDDVGAVIAKVENAVATGETYNAEYRVLLPEGGQRWTAARGRIVAGVDGAATALLGALYDVTALREATAGLAHVLETMTVGYLVLAADWRITYVNTEAVHALARPREELVGGVLWELFPATVGTVFEAGYRRVAATGKAFTFDAYYPAPLDAWYEIRATPEGGGVALYFVDITERQRAQQARDAAAHRLQRITDFTLALGQVHTMEDLVSTVAEDGLSELGCNGGSVAIVDDDDDDDDEILGSYLTSSYGQASQVEYGRLSLSRELPVTLAARTGRRVLVADRAACLAFSAEMQQMLQLTGSVAFASMPLSIGGRVLGVLTAGWDQAQSFDAAQLSLLDTLTAQVTQTVQRLQALEAERAAARRVAGMSEALQRSLLTDLPAPDHLQLLARYVPAADEAQVGGDWYDAFMVRDGSTCLAIGDVTGHDQKAAVQMAQVRNVLRGVAHAVVQPPALILHALDWAMRDLAVGALATTVLAKVEQSPADAARGLRTLRWSNAGHPPPLLIHPDGHAELLQRPTDLMLGLGIDTDRHDHTQPLHPGATVLLYTDGLVERRGEDLDIGLRRLVEVAQQLAHLPLEQLCDELLHHLGEDSEDDVALLALRAHPEDQPRPAEAGPQVLPVDLTLSDPVFPEDTAR